jgi:hypothetical protein
MTIFLELAQCVDAENDVILSAAKDLSFKTGASAAI